MYLIQKEHSALDALTTHLGRTIVGVPASAGIFPVWEAEEPAKAGTPTGNKTI